LIVCNLIRTCVSLAYALLERCANERCAKLEAEQNIKKNIFVFRKIILFFYKDFIRFIEYIPDRELPEYDFKSY
jgi:hypothetical protein